MTTRILLTTLTGDTPMASQPFFDPRSTGDTWHWVADYVAEEFGCSPDDVHCTEDDVVTAEGTPVARLVFCC